MNIFIAGGGRVGCHLARLLCADKHNVTVIEMDRDITEQIDYSLDVSTLTGDGSSALLLQSVGVGSADLFVGAMGDDETNLIAAATAKGLGAKQVAARVDNPMYMDANILYETILGVDYIMSPDALAALEIADYIEQPGVMATEEFGRGLVQMQQVRVAVGTQAHGKALKDIVPPKSGVLVGVVNHKGNSTIPNGATVIEAGDLVTLIGHRDGLLPVQRLFRGEPPKPNRVVIMGGATVGLRLAAALEGKMGTVKLFERREDRCTALAEKLKKTKVVCRDATSRVALEQEHIDGFDVFVAATGDDERNIMAGVLAKEVGAKIVISLVHQPDFAPLVERLGIDFAITPRACVANRILRLVHQGQLTSLSILGEGQVEVAEMAVSATSPIVGKKLKETRSKIPEDALIAVILRGKDVIVPSGEDEVRANDSVVVIASSEALEAARKVLQRK